MTRILSRRISTALYCCAAFLIIQTASVARAHPMLENGLDVVIAPRQITIDARISPAELYLVEAPGAALVPAEKRAKLIQQHASYVAKHLRIEADNHVIEAASAEFVDPIAPAGQELSPASLLNYRLRYNVSRQPAIVRIEQNFLSELPAWSASCVVRIRQADQPNFDTTLLAQDKAAEYSCQWPQTSAASAESTLQPVSASNVNTDVKIREMMHAYTARWITHLPTNYYYLLWVGVMVAAARCLREISKRRRIGTRCHVEHL